MIDYSSLDLVGYETIIDFIEKYKLYRLEGDILEIGSFLGGGTRKLSKLAFDHKRTVFTVDVFSPDFDKTVNLAGFAMSDIYNWFLQGKNQRDIFNKVTEDCENIEVISKDSMEIDFPPGQNFFFSFIDGNHDPAYVKNDFKVAWNNTVSQGVVAFHDYKGDLPVTTAAIDEILTDYKKGIERIEHVAEKCILFLFKK